MGSRQKQPKKFEKIISRQDKIVLVTGCFDILEPKLSVSFREAKKQGDVLILGLESDKRVRELKGKNRPINSYSKRAENLAKIKEIDFIFPLLEKFDGREEHLKLLQLIKPNILAVSENTPYLEKKKKLIEKVGGKIFIFPFNSRYSTTKLIST